MSAAIYSEPYKLPAGALALVVHGAFFVLMYFGVSWQAQPPQGMVVDIWNSLPEMDVPTEVEPSPAAKVEPAKLPVPPKLMEPPKPTAPPKADIQLMEKKKPQPKPVEVEPSADEVLKEVLAEAELNAKKEQARARAEQAAQSGKVVDEFIAKIQAKIKGNIVLPPDVPKGARAEFNVTLLPGGSILDVHLAKRSGDDAYDRAVERAILKSQPLPLPPDVALFKRFRDLKLGFEPYDTKE